MSQKVAGQHKKDCFRTLFINFLEELTKHELMLPLAGILQPNSSLRSRNLFRTN